MGRPLAWDIINKVVWPRLDAMGIKNGRTICSTKDWNNGVALQTDEGTIHVLGTGEVIDESNVLSYPEY